MKGYWGEHDKNKAELLLAQSCIQYVLSAMVFGSYF